MMSWGIVSCTFSQAGVHKVVYLIIANDSLEFDPGMFYLLDP